MFTYFVTSTFFTNLFTWKVIVCIQGWIIAECNFKSCAVFISLWLGPNTLCALLFSLVLKHAWHCRKAVSCLAVIGYVAHKALSGLKLLILSIYLLIKLTNQKSCKKFWDIMRKGILYYLQSMMSLLLASLYCVWCIIACQR